MEYYTSRNGLLNLESMKLNMREFRRYFEHTYTYFEEKGDFKLAFWGDKTSNFKAPLMKPSPEAFLYEHTGKKRILPLYQSIGKLDRETIFTLIEILYQFVWEENSYKEVSTIEELYERDNKSQVEFREMINRYLKHLDEGYELSDKGYIIDLQEDVLRNLIYQDLPEKTDDTITEQVETAIKMFFKHDSNLEEKKKAITILADILEPLRQKVKNITSSKHDALIFNTVNQYGIRHNNIDQKTNYDKPIWYEWMFHYYLATIHATLRLDLDQLVDT